MEDEIEIEIIYYYKLIMLLKVLYAYLLKCYFVCVYTQFFEKVHGL